MGKLFIRFEIIQLHKDLLFHIGNEIINKLFSFNLSHIFCLGWNAPNDDDVCIAYIMHDNNTRVRIYNPRGFCFLICKIINS